MKQKLKRIPKKVGTKIRSKVIATLLRMRHRAITCKNQILINNFFHDHFDLDYTRHEDVRTVVETMMTARRTHRNRMHAYFKKFPSKEAALLKPHPDTTEEQWKELCDLFTSEAFMKQSEQNKKNRSKLTVNHAAGSRSFQRTRACMMSKVYLGEFTKAIQYGFVTLELTFRVYVTQRSAINRENRAKLKIVHTSGARSFQCARALKKLKALQLQHESEEKSYIEVEIFAKVLGMNSG
ncbi:hypothetical protein CJ030_MR3G018314 [Morella rubra]|uniref:Uncharacterized protein n=1 Tax=Morella rubra TaxID=262757 RepID=A0A6A1W6S2_9ROSI|nr:hypothetical protein CJ030_MR3G018314 [Morella rubra]